MPRTKSPARGTPNTFAERTAKFESKEVNVGRERAAHRRNSKTVVRKGEGDRGDQKLRNTVKRKKTARKKR